MRHRLTPTTPAFRSPPGLRLFVNGLLVLWAAVVLVVMIDTPSFSGVWGLAVATALLGAGLAPVVRRVAASDGSHLVVNNGYRSRAIPWSEVEAFRLDASFWSGAVVAVLRSGEPVRLSATTVAFWAGRRRWDDLEESRELLSDWRMEAGKEPGKR